MFASFKRMLRREKSLPASYLLVRPRKQEATAKTKTVGRAT
jgi:hypothetical protein